MPRFPAIRRLELKRALQQPHPTKLPPNRPRNQHNPLDIPHPDKTGAQRGDLRHRQTQRPRKPPLLPVIGRRAAAIGDIEQPEFAHKSLPPEELAAGGLETENRDQKHDRGEGPVHYPESEPGELPD